MDYRKFGESYYIRLDKGDEIITSLLDICGKESISSATFYGIGGCSSAEIQTFIPESGSFETETVSGMLELVSMTGNIAVNESGRLTHHTHALFSYKQDGAHLTSGGHIKSITVLYTAEIELRPVVGGIIRKKKDPITGTGFWNFD
ncbi:MAG: DUF296 domain-containing protein [Ruminococcus sp.]|nr:DUF296 domain-containing protein [Ruminococcus sp.]